MRRGSESRRARAGLDRWPPLVGAVLGDLEGPLALIDEKGRVDVGPGEWRLEWGVGASDRWHVAHEEVAVRQHRIDDAPVYATWMRVPGGDVIQRAAVVGDGLGRGVLLEFENASSDAVAVALAARVWRGGTVAADPEGVTLDREVWLRPERPAGAVFAGKGDPWPPLTAGPTAGPAEARVRKGPAAGGLIVAVPHRQKLRILASVEGPPMARWVTPAEVAAGWRAVTDGAPELDLPDPALGEAWRRVVADVVVQAGSPEPRLAAEAAVVLDIAGLHAEADRARATVVAAAEAGRLSGDDAVAALRSLASRELIARETSGLAELAGPLEAAAGRLADRATLSAVARALAPCSPRAAEDARRLAERASRPGFAPSSPPAVAAARILSFVVAFPEPGEIDLSVLPALDEGWLGQPIDVRGLVTEQGRISFSVRWHGERPALLWERAGGPDDVVLRCPGLDAAWCSGARSGEALLAARPGDQVS